MKLSTLHEFTRDALSKHGNLDVVMEILDHGSMEQLEPTTTFVDLNEIGIAKTLIITAIIRD